MARVLVVDDDHTVREVVVSYLRAHEHDVVEAATARPRCAAMREAPADLVVLDLMLPGIDGLEVCRRLREASDVPVIMLTALGGETDRVVGLERGADDYVTKPFSPRELALRVDSVLRRTGERTRPASGSPTATSSSTATSTSPPLGGERLSPDRPRVRPAALPGRAPGHGVLARRAARRRCGAGRSATTRPSPCTCAGCGRRSSATRPARAAGHGVGRRLPVGGGVVSDQVADRA